MFTLPELPYAYDALEPHLDGETFKIHHGKHHQGYTDKLNKALEAHPEFYEKSIEDILSDLDAVPEDIRKAVRNNGGGYYHHSLFWQMMSPDGGGEPAGELADAINADFGSFAEFKEKLSTAALTHFGSGWGWLVKDKEGKLSVTSTPNQDSPVSEGLKPLLTIDVWEHAYYLKYQNRRNEFIEAFWNVVNWEYVDSAFKA